MAQNDREFGVGRGNAIDTDLAQYRDRRENEYARWTGDLMSSYEDPFGYNEEERNLILPGERLNSLGMTEDQRNALRLTDAEWAAIEGAGRDETGDYALNARLREGAAGVEGAVDAGETAYNAALTQQENDMRPWIDERMLRRDQNVAGDIGINQTETQNRIRAATNATDLRAREGLGSEIAGIDTATGSTVDSYLSNPNLQYSDTARAGIMGDLSGGESRIRSSYDPAAMRTGADFTNRMTGIADANAAQALGAIDRTRLRYDPNAAARTSGTLTDSAGRIRAATDTGRLSQDPNFTGNVEGALSGGETGLRGTVDPSRLSLSSEFTEDYNWTPEDTQRMATQASGIVGANARARRAALLQRANAEGNASPLAIEAAEARSRIAEDVAGADAITNARIAGRQRELETTLGREEMRLGAERDISGRQSTIEDTLGGRRLSSVYNTEQMRQDAERARAQIQAGAEADIATRDINTTLEQEGRRLAAESGATQTELGQLNQNTANRLGALQTGEQMRVGSEQAAGQIEAQNEQAILDRRTQLQQLMETERARLAQSASQARAGAAQTEAQRRTSNILNAEQLRTGAANTAARTISDAEAGIASRYTDARLGAEQQRLGAEQFITNSGLNTEQYLGGSRLAAAQNTTNARTAARENAANRATQAATYLTGLQSDTARFLGTNRQQAEAAGQEATYNRGMGIYSAGAQAGQTVGQGRMNQQGQYRQSLENLATQSGQAATVTNNTRVQGFGTQGNVQNTATGNAIRNYGIPGTAEKIGGMILGSLADGGAVPGQPEHAIVGEAGPELVIDIPTASRFLPKHGLGSVIGNAVGGWGAADRHNASLPPSTSGMVQDTETGEMAPGSYEGQERPKPKNRMWEALRDAVYTPEQAQFAASTVPADYTAPQQPRKSGGGLLALALKAMGGAADGGTFPGKDGDQPVSRMLSPGVKYVNGPQIDQLGENGPEAVVPMTDRPNARLTMQDVPSLLNRYRSGQPIPTMAEGGTRGGGPMSLEELRRIAAERRAADEQFNRTYGGGNAPAPATPTTAPVPMASRQQLPAPASTDRIDQYTPGRLAPPIPMPAPPQAGPLSLDQLQQIAAQRRREDEQFTRTYGGVPTPAAAPDPRTPDILRPRAVVDPVEEFLPTVGRVPDYVPPARVAPAAFNPDELANPYGRMTLPAPAQQPQQQAAPPAPPQPQPQSTAPPSAPAVQRPATVTPAATPHPAQQQVDERRNMTQAAPAPPPQPQQPAPAPPPSNNQQPGMGMYAAATGAPKPPDNPPAAPAAQPQQPTSRLTSSPAPTPSAPSTATRQPQAEQPQQQPAFQPERPKALADGGVAAGDPEGFDWFGLETMRRLTSGWGQPKPQPQASVPESDNMDVVRESVRRQMSSQKKQGAKQVRGGISPPPTQTNKRKEARP